jgi:hypothetical protein
MWQDDILRMDASRLTDQWAITEITVGGEGRGTG